LENVVERACVLANENVITPDDLPDEVRNYRSTQISTEVVRPLHCVEREYILAVLDLNQGNKTRTATQLGIGAATLFRKLRRYAESAKLPIHSTIR
jgi:DNA-binding NtrC family response regulator